MASRTDKKAKAAVPAGKEDLTPSSNITYNNEVVAIIAGLAANEVEGIAGMCNVSGSLMSKNRNVTKGVKVEVGTEEVAVDLYVIMEYGIPIQRAAADAQENVRKAIESMTGLHVVRVDVHVQSVSFEQEKKALQAGAQNAALSAGESEPDPTKIMDQTGKTETKPSETSKITKNEKTQTAPEETPVQEKPVRDDKTGDAPVQKTRSKAEPKTKAKTAKTDKKTDGAVHESDKAETKPADQEPKA